MSPVVLRYGPYQVYSEPRAGGRVKDVRFLDDSISVDLLDGRTISAPLAWFPRLLQATPDARANWRIAGGGYGIHWPDLDEDLNTHGLLQGAPAPRRAGRAAAWRTTRGRRPSAAEAPASSEELLNERF